MVLKNLYTKCSPFIVNRNNTTRNNTFAYSLVKRLRGEIKPFKTYNVIDKTFYRKCT